jgi:hypothetical protein
MDVDKERGYNLALQNENILSLLGVSLVAFCYFG